jgi:hypothetical protein
VAVGVAGDRGDTTSLVRAVLAGRATRTVGAAWVAGAPGFGGCTDGAARFAVTLISGKVGVAAGEAGADSGAAGAGAAGADSGMVGEDSGTVGESPGVGTSAGCACNDAHRQTLVARATAPPKGRFDMSRFPHFRT